MVSTGQALDVKCTYVKMTQESAASVDLVVPGGVISTDANDNQINLWNCTTSCKVAVSIPGTTVAAGVSSEWVFDVTPDNMGIVAGFPADVHMKFKVSQKMPKGTVVDITSPDNLVLNASGDLMDSCFSMIQYTDCSIQSGKI